MQNIKPKVVHVMYSGLGGHGNVVFTLLESRFGRHFDNLVVFYGIEPVVPEYTQRLTELGIPSLSIIKRRKAYLSPFAKFRHYLNDTNPDRIIVHSSELIVPAVSYRRKHPACRVYYVEHEPNQTKTVVEKLMSRYALSRADAVVCLHEIYKQELFDRYTVEVPVLVIPNGIDTGRFQPNVGRSRDTISVLGMAARMADTKDHAGLIRAFAELVTRNASLRLRLAGTGELEDRLKALVKDLGMEHSVEFCGLLDESQMIDFYRSLDLYVHATHSETLSTSLLQAMACEVPVLTSNIANNTVFIKDGSNGWLYRDGDRSDLQKKIDTLLSDPERTRAVTRAARATIEARYSQKTMSDGYMQLMANQPSPAR